MALSFSMKFYLSDKYGRIQSKIYDNLKIYLSFWKENTSGKIISIIIHNKKF